MIERYLNKTISSIYPEVGFRVHRNGLVADSGVALIVRGLMAFAPHNLNYFGVSHPGF